LLFNRRPTQIFKYRPTLFVTIYSSPKLACIFAAVEMSGYRNELLGCVRDFCARFSFFWR